MTSLQKWGKSVRTTIPVMAGYLVLGAGFGILLRTRGYGLGWALAMSAFIYAGSMQYVAIDLLTGGRVAPDDGRYHAARERAPSFLRHFHARALPRRGKVCAVSHFLADGRDVFARRRARGSRRRGSASASRASTSFTGCSARRSARLRARIWTLIRPASTFRSRRSFSRYSPSSGWRQRIMPRRSSVSAFRSYAVFCSARTASCCRRWAACSAPFGARRAPDEEGRRERMNTHAVLLIAVSALVTALIRFAPFLVFRGGRETPP